MKYVLFSLALIGCGDNLPARPVACGRYDINLGLECAQIPGEPIPPGIENGDPWIHVDTSEGVTLFVVHDCATQCSPEKSP